MSSNTAALAFAALCLAAAPLRTTAKPEFVARIPNGANVPGVDALGHTNPAGDGPRNGFGKDFDSAGRRWTVALCQKDSDGDGQTNGQELGDPCCAFVAGSDAKVLWTTGVSHPGDKSKTSDPSLWASISCAGSSSSAANSSSSGNSSSTNTTPSAGDKDNSESVKTPMPTTSVASARGNAVHTAAAFVLGAVLALALA